MNNQEKVQMLLIYGKCNRNSRQSAKMYAEQYPGCARNQQIRQNNINEDVEVQVLACIRLNPRSSHDGALAHNAHIIRDHLNRVYEGKWFGTYGPIEWPARSPDITPLDFFLWGHLKTIVYQ
ncbi:hypothetical protein QTP88_008416 [Uroleucon formosanum]